MGGIVTGRLPEARAAHLLARARQAEPTYAPVGLLLAADAVDTDADLCVERLLGDGPEVFAAAVACLRSLGPQRAVATVWPAGATAAEGATVLIGVPWGPVTVVALNRVLAVLDVPRRWGFAYATLPGHPLVGEEAFVVEHRDDDTVLARVTAVARVALPLARWAHPALVPAQRHFAMLYLDQVAAAVARAEASLAP
jgi:uncharacterized protein (UPF0548 family)